MDQNWNEVEQLVLRAQEGDREAFGELVVRFERRVQAHARSLQRDAHEASELVQEVFLHALRKIRQLREPACFGGWLRMITQRVAINRGTRRPRLPTAESEFLEQVAGSGASPLDQMVSGEERRSVRKAVTQLRPIDRDVLIAFYLKGKSLAVIADEFDIPLGTVKRRLHMARQRFAESLGSKRAPREERTVTKARRRRELVGAGAD